MKPLACLATIVAIGAMLPAQSSNPAKPSAEKMKSMIFDWQKLVPAPTRTGERRAAFDAPTGTLDKFHCHITTLNPGENTGPLHRNPQEELVIIKEGMLEVNINGKKQVAGPGSMVFFAVNENENMTNVGKTPATYYVLEWFTPLTPKN